MGRSIIISLAVVLSCVVIAFLAYNIFFKVKEIPMESFDTVKDLFYRNPQGITGIGDPYIFKGNDGYYYIIATSGGGGFAGYRSSDMVTWEKLPRMMYSRENNDNYWGINSFWAPCIIEKDGRYYMYYSARYPRTDQLLLSVAVSDKPEGPYIDVAPRPVFNFGYPSIDPDVFIDDDGRIYMYYSRDMSGNVVDGRPESHIYVVELNEDMISAKGRPVKLLTPDQPFELVTGNSRWNEGPMMIKHNNKYYLIYSGGFYGDRTYSLGYAVSDNPMGPFVKYEDNPILESYNSPAPGAPPIVSGPGHNSVIKSPDSRELFICYHSHTVSAKGGGDRMVNLDRAGFRKDGSLFINGPTRGYQPKPSGIIEYRNVALEASVTASKGDGSLLNDGDFVVAVKNYEKYSFNCVLAPGEELTMEIKLDKKYLCRVIQFYVLGDSDAFEADIYPARRNVIKDVKIYGNKNIPGHSIIVPFMEMDTDYVKIVIKNQDQQAKNLSLGEIVLLGKDVK